MEIGELSEQVLPGLVQELGELQATSILKGDYELKIARQDYFTSKQDQVSAQNTLKKQLQSSGDVIRGGWGEQGSVAGKGRGQGIQDKRRKKSVELLQHREAVADDKKEGVVFVRSTKVPPLGKNDSLSKNVLLFFLEVITQLLLQQSRREKQEGSPFWQE